MLLSNTAIREALEDGRLEISDYQECEFDSTSVNLTLSPIIKVPKEGPAAIRFGHGKLNTYLEANCDEYVINEMQPFQLKQNMFILATTKQKVWFKGPEEKISAWENKHLLAGRVEGKSSFARVGLLVHFTAPTIHNGYKGVITLEIINFGHNIIDLTLDRAVCQLLVEEISGEPKDYISQFHDQKLATGL